jgi:hypothetical protein
VGDVNTWSCATCNDWISLEAVIEEGGGRALVGYDSSADALFVAYRGSEDIQNWIDNVKFFKTAPYPDMPEVEVTTQPASHARSLFFLRHLSLTHTQFTCSNHHHHHHHHHHRHHTPLQKIKKYI